MKAKKLYVTFATKMTTTQKQDYRVLLPPDQPHLVSARAGLTSSRSALDIRAFLCMEKLPLWIKLEHRSK